MSISWRPTPCIFPVLWVCWGVLLCFHKFCIMLSAEKTTTAAALNEYKEKGFISTTISLRWYTFNYKRRKKISIFIVFYLHIFQGRRNLINLYLHYYTDVQGERESPPTLPPASAFSEFISFCRCLSATSNVYVPIPVSYYANLKENN